MTDVYGGFAAAQMMEVELTQPLPTVTYDGQRERVWILGRLHTEPIGVCVLQLGREGLTPDVLATLLWPEFRKPVTDRFAAAGLRVPRSLTGAGLDADPAAWPFLLERQTVLAAPPFISVVICTRDRPEQLESCLQCLDRQEYPRFEIVVVDNAPSAGVVRTLIEARRGGPALRYVAESRPGLAWARNAALAATRGAIVAFVDDDEEPDSHWLAGVAGGFAQSDDIGCVTGMVLPARLDTEAQDLFEQLGGFCKGRGFSSIVFSRHGPQSPLYPLPPFGAGANMSFRRDVLARIGGFDVALGAGTPTFAGEDTLALTLVLLAGYRIAYEPRALTRHHHRRDLDSLARQLDGYDVGLTAYYTALLRHRPSILPALLSLVPAATGYLRGGGAAKALASQTVPRTFRRKHRWHMATGPMAYAKSLRMQARAAGSVAHEGNHPASGRDPIR